MNPSTAFAVLFLAALLEAGGDAVMRMGIFSHKPALRAVLFGVGGLVLAVYGYVVNIAKWDFGKLLGLYVVFFVVVAQVLSWLVFKQPPSAGTLVGVALIVIGGIVIWMSNST